MSKCADTQILVPANAQLTRPPPSNDFNRFIQEMTQLTNDIDFFLQGLEEVRDAEGNKKVEQRGKPKVNQQGRRAIMQWVRIYLSPNTYLAENSTHNVSAQYQLDMANLRDELVKNHVEYGLDLKDFPAVHSQISQLIFNALQKSTTDKKYIFNTSSTSYNPVIQQEKKGGLAGILGL